MLSSLNDNVMIFFLTTKTYIIISCVYHSEFIQKNVAHTGLSAGSGGCPPHWAEVISSVEGWWVFQEQLLNQEAFVSHYSIPVQVIL